MALGSAEHTPCAAAYLARGDAEFRSNPVDPYSDWLCLSDRFERSPERLRPALYSPLNGRAKARESRDSRPPTNAEIFGRTKWRREDAIARGGDRTGLSFDQQVGQAAGR